MPESAYLHSRNTAFAPAKHLKTAFFLGRLSPLASSAIQAMGTRVALPRGRVVFKPGHVVDQVYFLEDGIAAIIAEGDERRPAGCALIGVEGYLVPAAVLGAGMVSNSCQMIVGGSALRISTASLLALQKEDALLQECLLKFVYVMISQMASTTLSQSGDSILERLSRLILMLHDRSFHHEIPISHSTLASILGVQRPSITRAMHWLEGEKLIVNDRRCIEVLDKDALRKAASVAYGRAEAEYNRIIDVFF